MYGPMLVWLVEPAGIVGWVLLVGIQAAFAAAMAALISPWARSPWLVPVAAIAWTGMDMIRGAVPFSGFDWGALGYTQVDSWLLPLARLGGERAVTLSVVLLGAAAFEVVRRAAAAAGPRAAVPALGGLAVVLLATAVLRVEPPAPAGEVVDVLIVQGNDIEQWEGGGRELDRAIARNMADLTRQAVLEGGRPDLTVWPESSIDRDPFTTTGSDLKPLLDEGARLVGGDLLVGATLDGPRPGTFRNTSLLVAADGSVQERYVKRRLVPFGEYVPFRGLIGDFPPLRQVPRDGVPERAPQALRRAPGRVAVVICFETLFADVVRSNVLAGDAGLIVASTNDASFGRGAESAQHIAQSRMRAVETGRHVVHAALSGASAFVTPHGEVTRSTGLFTQATLRAGIPVVVGTTPFLTAGDLVGKGAAAGVVLLLLLAVARSRRRGPDGQSVWGSA